MPQTSIFKDANGRTMSVKDPDAILDYPFDWTAWLEEVGDTIVDHEITVSANLNIEQDFSSGSIVTPFVSGGIVGTEESVACKIITSGGRVDERTVYLTIKNL